MALFVVFLVALNAGFLLGTWWGSGWRRREQLRLQEEVGRLKRALDASEEPGIVPLFDSSSQAG
jgi:hypothetical protein